MGMKIDSLFSNVYKNKKVLITGDSGFKGSWLAIWLNLLGADVYGYSLPPKTDKDNFAACNLDKKINHVSNDIRDKDSLITFFNKVQPDIAFHLAAQPIVLESYSNPHYTFDTNLMGTINFLEALRTIESVKSAVIVTSDKVYKNVERVWGYRENERLGGHDPYSASKACDELITNSYIQSFFNKTDSCSIATARAGNVIGGGDWGKYRIIPDFFRAVKNDEKLLIRNPDFVRPWQHVLEPLSGYLLLGAKLFTEGKKYSGAWNFGPSEHNHIPVQKLIEKIISITQKGEFQVSEKTQNEKETTLLQLDISKAINKLKWHPVLNIEECVKFTVEGYLADETVTDIYLNRAEQIKAYLELGCKKNINWIID